MGTATQRNKMATLSMCQPQVGGFNFENCKRNAVLEADVTKLGCSLPAARKTGTTICGIVFKDGIVLGADTRATEGMIVADKNCSKIHYISPNIYCCGAGTAADTEMTTQIISSNLELHALSTGRLPRVATACRMLKQMLFRYQGYIGAALVLGGVDCNGPHLYSIYPHGSTDLGSGSNIDLTVITKGNVDYLRPHDVANQKGVRAGDYKYKRGTTKVLKKDVIKLDLEVVEENVQTMDTS